MAGKRVLVTGAGGFIGHHLCTYLVRNGYWVRGADQKRPQYSATDAHEFLMLDLRDADNCVAAVDGTEEIYHLAADMGGIGFISSQHANIARNNTLMNIGMLEAARLCQADRFLYSSSACVYPHHLQTDSRRSTAARDRRVAGSTEEGNGLEKLYAEKLCEYYSADFGLNVGCAVSQCLRSSWHI